MSTESTVEPIRFSLTITHPRSTSGERPDALGELGAIAVKALSQQISNIAPERLPQIVLFELPLLNRQEDFDALRRMTNDLLSDRSWVVFRKPDRVRLIDAKMMEQWRARYPNFFEKAGEYRYDRYLSFPDFIHAVMGDSDSVNVCENNFSLLLDLADRGHKTCLIRRLSTYVLEHCRSCTWIDSKTQRQRAENRVVDNAVSLARVYPSFFQELWEQREKLVDQLCVPRSIARKKRVMQKIMAGIEVPSLTVRRLDKNIYDLLYPLDTTNVSLVLPCDVKDVPDTQDWHNLSCILHYNVESPNTQVHQAFLPIMPRLRSVRICLGPSSNTAELNTAFSELYFLERFDLKIDGQVEDGLVDTFFEHLQRWAIEELCLEVSAEHAETLPARLPSVLTRLRYLKKLSLSGMNIPHLTGPLPLQHFEIKNTCTPSAIELAEEEAALRAAAPDLVSLTLDTAPAPCAGTKSTEEKDESSKLPRHQLSWSSFRQGAKRLCNVQV